MPTIRALAANEAATKIAELGDVLIDCVHSGASVSFLPPLDRSRADAFWRRIAGSVAAGDTTLLVAETNDTIVGTVLVQAAGPENQPHRADIAKMLVHSSYRRQGLGRALMEAAEQQARANGKTLLVLDTETGGPGERLYTSLGWQRVGEVPGYALLPTGKRQATTFFYKEI